MKTVDDINTMALPYWMISGSDIWDSTRYTNHDSDNDIIMHYVATTRGINNKFELKLKSFERFEFLSSIPDIIPLDDFNDLKLYHHSMLLNHTYYFDRLSDTEISNILDDHYELLQEFPYDDENIYYLPRIKSVFLNQILENYTGGLSDYTFLKLNGDNVYKILRNVMFIKKYALTSLGGDSCGRYHTDSCVKSMKHSYGDELVERTMNKLTLLGGYGYA